MEPAAVYELEAPCERETAEPECIGDSAVVEVEADFALTAAAMESTADEEVYEALKTIAEFRLKADACIAIEEVTWTPISICYGAHPEMRLLQEAPVFLPRNVILL